MSDTSFTGRQKKQRLLTVEAFDLLLACLHADREQASIKYEELRVSLMTYFAVQGAPDPSVLADETLNRVAYRLAEGQVIQAENPAYYFLGVARNVWREQLAQPYRLVSLTDQSVEESVQIVSPEELLLEFEQRLQAEQEHDCFTRCLESLPEVDRALLIEYHQGQGRANSQNRQAMSRRFGITLGSLRNRVSRIRDRMAKCIQDCSASEDQV